MNDQVVEEDQGHVALATGQIRATIVGSAAGDRRELLVLQRVLVDRVLGLVDRRRRLDGEPRDDRLGRGQAAVIPPAMFVSKTTWPLTTRIGSFSGCRSCPSRRKPAPISTPFGTDAEMRPESAVELREDRLPKARRTPVAITSTTPPGRVSRARDAVACLEHRPAPPYGRGSSRTGRAHRTSPRPDPRSGRGPVANGVDLLLDLGEDAGLLEERISA